MKKCKDCKETKPFTEYHKMSKAKDGHQYICKVCRKELEKTRRDYHKKKMKRLRANPEYRIKEAANKRDYRLQYWYGITEEEYYVLLEKQNYCCKICSVNYKDTARTLAVDHNHETNEVRGLLCDACNRALGMFKDSPELLYKALQYLKAEGYYGR